jgi:phosphoglycerol transferase
VTDFAAKDTFSTELKPKLAWVIPCALGLLSLLAGWLLVIGPSRFDLLVPLIYSGDGLLILALIKRVMENPWIFHSAAMGAPFGSFLYDYPIPDSGSLLALKIFGLISGSAAVALNAYYLLGFPLNALSGYFVARAFRVSRALSFAAGFIFTLLPFHFLRLGHLFYTWYFTAPLFILFAKKIYDGDDAFLTNRPNHSKNIWNTITLLSLSCFGVYYSFFGVLSFLTAGSMRFLRERTIRSAIPCVLAVAIITCGTVANVAPNLMDRAKHGTNAEVAQRTAAEAEIYGLKIVQLLLPRPGHRITFLAKLNSNYSTVAPLVNENITSSLGLIGSVGFLTLFVALLAPRLTSHRDERVHFLASVTFILVLFCTIGGGSALFSVLISPMIRAWNRVSVFIAFTCICSSMVLVQQLLEQRRMYRPAAPLVGIIAVALCGIAIWDQTTPPCRECLSINQSQYESDVHFVAAIENASPKSGMIYQLPYMAFPEVPPLNALQSYDQIRGYLHSKRLRWSYGGIKGRSGDLFFRALGTEPLERQITVVRRIGFSGLYVDRRGYADHGTAIEAELTRLLGEPPKLVSDNGQQMFFDLTNNGASFAPLPSDLSTQQIIERAGFGLR